MARLLGANSFSGCLEKLEESFGGRTGERLGLAPWFFCRSFGSRVSRSTGTRACASVVCSGSNSCIDRLREFGLAFRLFGTSFGPCVGRSTGSRVRVFAVWESRVRPSSIQA